MPTKKTPSEVMYADLKAFGGLAYKDAARILLSSQVIYGGRAPRDRVDERTFLSRVVVHAHPSKVNPGLFAEFPQSAQVITSRIISRLGGGDTAREMLIEHYAGSAAREMSDSLASYGLDANLFANLVERLANIRLSSRADTASLVVMAFIATGCLGNPVDATAVIDRTMQKRMKAEGGTITAELQDQGKPTPSDGFPVNLGLIRMVDGMVRPPIYALMPTLEGTVVGALATGESGINDVEIGVSRRHLRIWKEDGAWLCQGLGSTNGTTLISGKTHEVVVVEPPKRERHGREYPPVRVRSSDELCLGKTTRFLVMPIMA